MTSRWNTVAPVRRISERPAPTRLTMPGSRTAHFDPRWIEIERALNALRRQRRRAVRIVDADCSCGTLLIAAARLARTLGFTAIEARGIDGSPALIGRARVAAARLGDPAIGMAFEVADAVQALESEAAFPADIVLWHADGDESRDMRTHLAAAGRRIIKDKAGVRA